MSITEIEQGLQRRVALRREQAQLARQHAMTDAPARQAWLEVAAAWEAAAAAPEDTDLFRRAQRLTAATHHQAA